MRRNDSFFRSVCNLAIPVALRAKIAVEKLGELKMGKLIQNEIRLPVSLVVRASTK